MSSQTLQFDLIRVLLKSSLKSRYRQTFSGFFWVILNPIILYTTQSIVFRYFLKIDLPNYFLFLLSTLLPWLFLVQTLEMTTNLIVQNGQLLKSFNLNPMTLTAVQSLDNLINFTCAFLILFIVMLGLGQRTEHLAWLFPLPFFSVCLAALAGGFLLSIINVFFRDLKFIVTFIFNVSFFLTPIFYPIEYVPEPIQHLIVYNPFYVLLRPLRLCFFETDLSIISMATLKSYLLSASIAIFALWIWKLKKNEIYYKI